MMTKEMQSEQLMTKEMPSEQPLLPPRRLRSYVVRGRMTEAQGLALQCGQPLYGLDLGSGLIDYQQVFGREAARFLEIGFGGGHSLLQLASAWPESDFIGVETHRPGIGSLCQGIAAQGLSNLRFYHEDVMDVLAKAVPDASLDGIQLFFPDPWPKRRHHQRRLIQTDFIALVSSKLKAGGELHMATDWEEYAIHMMRILSTWPSLVNMAGAGRYAGRSRLRPVITRFESRAVQEGRIIRELQFYKVNGNVALAEREAYNRS